MEKPAARSKRFGSSILNFLPRTASAVTFQYQSPPLSPTHRDAKLRAAVAGGRSSLVPAEARRKPKNGGLDPAQEPSSPVVSCIGRIKSKKKAKIEEKNQKKIKNKRSGSKRVMPPPPDESESNFAPVEEKKKRSWGMSKIFWGLRSGKRSQETNSGNFEDGKSTAGDDHGNEAPPPPSLDQMKRFVSGRDALSNFDWKSLGEAIEPNPSS